MNFVSRAKQHTRVTASGATVLTSGPCVIEGIFVPQVLTAPTVNLYSGNTATTEIVGTCTLAGNAFYEFPMSLPTGLTYAVSNDTVDLTIFWSPAG